MILTFYVKYHTQQKRDSSLRYLLQWGSEIRTNPDFGWSILTRTGCPNIDHPTTGYICPVLGWSKN
jgi:hypothetical protein